MTKKKPEPNPIEEAIGDRVNPKKGKLSDLPENAVLTPVPQNPSEIPDEPSPSEMLALEELNRRTEERLQEQELEKEIPIPVSKPDPQLVAETSSPELPPQSEKEEITFMQGELDKEMQKKMFREAEDSVINQPAEDVELTALKKYIREDGFVPATVAFHIKILCAEPMTTPSTTTWDFADRAKIPEMVFALLNQPGYIEGIWPSLRIVMGSNKGNSAWSAGIAITIAFFDVIHLLPVIKEFKNEA
uniref:Uncharacterized protein n=1 Tax=viral metagenome TaxID=1070528 RepID=A0A6M3JZB6_9ZZZZ